MEDKWTVALAIIGILSFFTLVVSGTVIVGNIVVKELKEDINDRIDRNNVELRADLKVIQDKLEDVSDDLKDVDEDLSKKIDDVSGDLGDVQEDQEEFEDDFDDWGDSFLDRIIALLPGSHY